MKKILLSFFIIFFIIQGIVQIFLFCVILAQWADYSISDEVIFKETQPEDIDYDGNNSYSFYIIKRQKLLDTDYIILISKDIEPSYGHVMNYIDPYVVFENDIKDTKIVWLEDGLEIHFPSEHILLVPKESFIGGR